MTLEVHAALIARFDDAAAPPQVAETDDDDATTPVSLHLAIDVTDAAATPDAQTAPSVTVASATD
jgi:hypothetical protein